LVNVVGRCWRIQVVYGIECCVRGMARKEVACVWEGELVRFGDKL